MARDKISRFSRQAVALPVDNIDTDQIIPARFLKTTDKEGLAQALFADWRGTPGFVLDTEVGRRAGVLVTGDNFGCGSSREHAPWALVAFGFQAIVSTGFADIFRGNALKNGLVPVEVPAGVVRALMADIAASGGLEVTVDVERQVLSWSGPAGLVEATFPLDVFAKRCLVEGVDELGYLLSRATAIDAYETRGGR